MFDDNLICSINPPKPYTQEHNFSLMIFELLRKCKDNSVWFYDGLPIWLWNEINKNNIILKQIPFHHSLSPTKLAIPKVLFDISWWFSLKRDGKYKTSLLKVVQKLKLWRLEFCQRFVKIVSNHHYPLIIFLQFTSWTINGPILLWLNLTRVLTLQRQTGLIDKAL